MERICKLGDDRSRNRDVVNEDRISELPEALLVQILSSLPTKNVIVTSVLSKRWRSLWKTVPNLKFDSYHLNAFSDNVYSSLVLHKAPFLESLYLKIRGKDDALDIGILMGIAFARHVRKLVLNVQFVEESLVTFPRVLCSSNNTLEILKLKYCILLAFPSRVCLTSLRKLHLHYVKFEDEDSVCNLLSGCPRLEDLVVNQRSYADVQIFSITVPSLQRLTVEEDNNVERDGSGYVINAPSLKYLNISRINGLQYFLIENMPELVEAHIIDVSNIAIETILESLTSAKRLCLHLSPLEIKFPIGSIFCQLVSLELCTGTTEWWILLAFMLKSSPKLQILKLIRTCLYSNKDPHVGLKWNHPTCLPECLLFHLETLVWKRYKWQREDEKLVATYILKNARRLKNATFSTKPIKPGKLEKSVKRREKLDELASIVRASSNSCHLVFKSE